MSTMFRSGSGENIAGIVRQMSHPAVRIKDVELDANKTSHHSSSTSLVWKSAENLYQATIEDDLRSKPLPLKAPSPVRPLQRKESSPGDARLRHAISAPVPDQTAEADMLKDDGMVSRESSSEAPSKESAKAAKKNAKLAAKSEKSSKKFGKSGSKKDKKEKMSYSSSDSKANTDTEEQRQQVRYSRSISVNDRVGYEATKDRNDSISSAHSQHQLLKQNISSEGNVSFSASPNSKSHKSDNLSVSRLSSHSANSSASAAAVPVAESTHLSSGGSTSVEYRSSPTEHYVPYRQISEESSSPASPLSQQGNNGWQDAVDVQRKSSSSSNGLHPADSDRTRQNSSPMKNQPDSSSVRRISKDVAASDMDCLILRSEETTNISHKSSVVGISERLPTENHYINEENCSGIAVVDGDGINGSLCVTHPSVVVNSPSTSDLNGYQQNRLRSDRRSPSPRPPTALSGAESGGDDCTYSGLKDSISRYSESTRSTGSQSVVSQKEKSPPQGSSEKDKKSKKAWYNVLNPNYKSRSEDLKRLFKDLPLDERLLVDYSCAMQKDILVHGRLYVTPNFFCFYSKIFGWETLLSIRCKDIVSMTKEKTALVIPNAIQMTTCSDKHFFTTFSARDKAYLMLFRIWQNALMDQQMPAGELWQWVHSSYGDQLGLTSDDDDYIAPSTTEDDQKHVPHIVPSEPSYVASSSGSDKKTATKTVGTGGGHGAPMAAGDAPASLHPYTDVPASDTGEGDSRVPDAASHAEFGRSSPALEPLHPASVTSLLASSKPVSPAKNKASSKHSSKHSSPIKTLSTVSVNNVADIDHTDSVDSDDQSSRVSTGLGSLEVVVCPVQKSHHVGREIVNTVYAIPIDSLFTLLFTNSKMMLEVHALRKTTDVVASPWQSKNDGQQRLRQVTYTVALPTNSFGPKVSHVTETQVMSELTVPGEYYSVDAEASNAGIPYAESFLVSNHWCLTRESCSETRLAVYTSVKYKKNMWGFMKSVIDKNACSGVEGLLQGIDSALQQEVTEHANMHQRTRRRRRRGTVKLESEVPGSVPGLMPAADVTAAGTGVAALKDKTKAKLPVNNILVNRLLGSTTMRPPALARPPALGSGTAALNAAWRDDSVDATSMSWPNCRVLIMTFLLLLLLFTNLMLFWRLTKLEELVRLQPHYAALRGFMQLDPDVVRKEIRSDAMLQILQEQEVAHVKMTEDWRTRISEAETLLHQAEGMLRGLHATIPTEQSAASRALLERLRESSLSLQADIDSSVQPGPELPYNFNDLESDSSHSRHEL